MSKPFFAISSLWQSVLLMPLFLALLLYSNSAMSITTVDAPKFNVDAHTSIAAPRKFQLDTVSRDLDDLSSGTYRSARDKDGFFWFLNDMGLYRYDGIELIHVVDRYSEVVSGAAIFDLVVTDNTLWMGGPHGLFKLNLTSYELLRYTHDQHDPNSLSHNHITALTVDYLGRFWASHRKGLSLYNPESNSFENFLFPDHLAKNTGSTSVQSVALDRDGLLWVHARENGVFILNVDLGIYYPAANLIEANPRYDFHQLFFNAGKGGVYRDVNGNIIVGIQGNILEFSAVNSLVNVKDLREYGGDGNSSPRRFTNDSSGNIWAIYGSSGLLKYSRLTDSVSFAEVDILASRVRGRSLLYGLSIGEDGAIVLCYSKTAPKFAHVSSSEVERIDLREMVEGVGGNFKVMKLLSPTSWLLMSETELLLFDREKNSANLIYTIDPSDIALLQLFVNDKNDIWLRTFSGVYKGSADKKFEKILNGRFYSLTSDINRQMFFQIDNDKILQYDHYGSKRQVHNLSGLGVSSIRSAVSNGENVIVFHDEGVVTYDKVAQSFVRVTLPENYFLKPPASVFVEDGDLWISGSHLGRYRMIKKNTEYVFQELDKMSYIDGFRYGRIKGVTDDGVWVLGRKKNVLLNLKFGGSKSKMVDVGGLISTLSPTSNLLFLDNFKVAILGAFAVNIIERQVLDKLNVRYSQSLNSLHLIRNAKLPEIILKPIRNFEIGSEVGVVEFRFSNNSTIFSVGNSIKYRLKGLSDSWISSDTGRASYSGLRSGKYRFQIYDENTGELSVDFPVDVLAPFWLSIPAYFVYSMLLASLAALLYYLWWSRMYLEKKFTDMLRVYAKGFEHATNAFVVVDDEMNVLVKNKIFDRLLKVENVNAEIKLTDFNMYADDGGHDNGDYISYLLSEGAWEGKLIYDYQHGNFTPFYCKAVEVKQDLVGRKLYMFILEDGTQRHLYESELKHVANTDALTDLPNRHYLASFIGERIKSKRTANFALIYIDLDRFKNFNDSFSHGFGDDLLIEFASRVKSCVESKYLLCRIGGDEFVLVVEDKAAIERCTLISKNIINALQQPFTLKKRELYCSASIGVVLYPHHGDNMNLLLQHADVAMSRIKKEGGSGYVVYHKSMLAEGEKNLRIEGQLRKAIASDRLSIFYQPKVRMSDSEPVSYEALVRFILPNGELAPTEEFIEVAENTGLIVPVSRIVVALVCEQLCKWRAQGLEIRPIAINLSGCLFSRFDLLDELDNFLRSYDLPASYIEFEITENVLMQDMEQTIHSIKALRERGHPISIDDFGTGYSSLSYLAQLPLNTIKIDRSFVDKVDSECDQQSIIHAVLELASSFDLDVVAEGIENQRVHKYLQSMGCDYGQGYYYGKPLPADQLVYSGQRTITVKS